MEITRKNFSVEFENITKTLNKSCFVGFDAEFTGILSGECFQHSLFDTNEERYDKIKNEVSKMIMTQVGLTMFHYDRDRDTYIAHSYTFHLCPQVLGDINQSFIFQASTLRFLCQHNFDFNKFTYDGLPFISKAEEAHIRKQLKEKTLLNNLILNMDMADERILQSHCSEVAKWLVGTNEDTIYLDIESPVMRYIVHCELRNRFPDILTTNSLGNSNKVLVYRHRHVEGAGAAAAATLEDDLMSSVLGFSRVVRLLERFQKPIVGHNMFLDTVLLHSQFVGPLPRRYSAFKRTVGGLLPRLYDTKYISHEMGGNLTRDEAWKSTALQDLYEFFSEGKCRRLQEGTNSVEVHRPFGARQSYHEAGWDSYCAGYCFLRLGEWSSRLLRGSPRPPSPGEVCAALASHRNKVNVIRGAVSCMNLMADDPPSHRPDLLHIRSARGPRIDVAQVSSLLASFGSLDIKPYGRRTALIAAGSQHTADKLLKHFRINKDYRITPFASIRHSRRLAIWGGAIITGSIFLFFIHRKINK